MTKFCIDCKEEIYGRWAICDGCKRYLCEGCAKEIGDNEHYCRKCFENIDE